VDPLRIHHADDVPDRAALARSVEALQNEQHPRGLGTSGAGGEQALLQVVEQRLEFGAQVVAVLVLAIGVSGLGIRVEIAGIDRTVRAAQQWREQLGFVRGHRLSMSQGRGDSSRIGKSQPALITCRTASP